MRVVDKWLCEFSGECEKWGREQMHFPADDNVVKMSTCQHWLRELAVFAEPSPSVRLTDVVFVCPDAVGYKPDSFMFELETNGQMAPEQVVLSAFEVLDEKCDTILRAEGGGGGGIGGGDSDDDFSGSGWD